MIWLSVNLDFLMQNFLRIEKILPLDPTVLRGDYPPTIAESGLPGFEANNWYGVVVPAKTPQSIVTRLNTELVKVLNSPGLRETYANQGIEAIPSTPAEFTAYIRSEIVKWGKIVKAAGIKAD
jgi:tripartite-type tricarboxylate transporter receptor subunit TctC